MKPVTNKLYPKYEGPIVGGTIVLLMLVFTLIAWLSAGCASKPVPVVITHPVLVKIEEEPKPDKPTSCYLESMPEAPKEIENLLQEDDVVRRVFVHIRQYNEMTTFAHDMTMWGGSVAQCIDDLTELLTQ